MTLLEIRKAVKKGWYPPDGTPLMDFIWNTALDAAAEECYFTDHIKTVELVAQTIQERILARKDK